MTIIKRPYRKAEDFDRISQFLMQHHQPGNRDGNWLQPTWEYMHSHPALDESALDKIGVWEEVGQIVAVAHYESTLGEAFFELHPDHAHLKPELLDHAEANLVGTNEQGERHLHVYIPDFDADLEALVQSRGYQPDPDNDRPMSLFTIPTPFPAVSLPDGFHLKSLQEDNDLHKLDRVLWRGFNHSGEPPADNIDGRKKMQSVPNYNKELNIIVQAPDGNFAAYAGNWYEPVNHFGYVEPVATDPAYRRLGLGKAAVLEGIRRCAALGATVSYVGSNQLFYFAIGFKLIFTSRCWLKKFPAVHTLKI